MKEQIEEMGKLCPFYEEGKCNLLEDEAAECNFNCDMCDFARTLYNAGYRKEQKKLEPIGRWVLVKPRRINRNATYKCSQCGKLCSSYYNDVGEWKSCPHCRTRMGGVEVQCKNKLRKS